MPVAAAFRPGPGGTFEFTCKLGQVGPVEIHGPCWPVASPCHVYSVVALRTRLETKLSFPRRWPYQKGRRSILSLSGRGITGYG